MKGVLDTPILLTAALKEGFCRQILRDGLQNQVLYTSPQQLLTFIQVTRRPHMAPFKDYLEKFIILYAECAKNINPTQDQTADLKNLGEDQRNCLNIALMVQANFFVTSRPQYYETQEIQGTLLLSPEQFREPRSQI